MDIDSPEKDDYLLRKARADQVIVASDQRWALICKIPNQPVSLVDLAARTGSAPLDLTLVEGFKEEPLALWRQGVKGEMTQPLTRYCTGQ